MATIDELPDTDDSGAAVATLEAPPEELQGDALGTTAAEVNANGPAEPEATPAEAQQPARPDFDDPAVMANRLRRIEECEERCRQSMTTWTSLAEQTKEAKKEYDADVLALRRAARACSEELPLFDAPAPSAATAAGQQPATATQAAPDDAWRSVPITELGLTESLTDKLQEAGIETIGQLEDQRAGQGPKPGPKGLREIKGIGQGKVDVIEAAVLKWLSEFRDAEALQAVKLHQPAEGEDFTDYPWPVDPELGSIAEGGSPAWKDAICARADAIEDLAPVARGETPYPDIYDNGAECQRGGGAIHDCCWAPGKRRDSWLAGFIAAYQETEATELAPEQE